MPLDSLATSTREKEFKSARFKLKRIGYTDRLCVKTRPEAQTHTLLYHLLDETEEISQLVKLLCVRNLMLSI